MAIPFKSQIDMGAQKIVSLLDPTNPQDAATKNYVDTRPAPIVGATFFSVKPRGLIKNSNSSAVTSQGVFGTAGTNFTSGGTSAQVAAAFPEPAALNISTGAVASINAFGICEVFANPHNYDFGFFRRFQARISLGNNANIRSWIGIANIPGSLPSITMATNDPAIALVGFRFSKAAGDTTWQCVTQSAAGPTFQSIIDSGVAPVVGTSALFEITYDGVGTVTFFIDGVQVAQTTTNVMVNTTPYLSLITVDNQNSANNVSINWSYLFAYERL